MLLAKVRTLLEQLLREIDHLVELTMPLDWQWMPDEMLPTAVHFFLGPRTHPDFPGIIGQRRHCPDGAPELRHFGLAIPYCTHGRRTRPHLYR